VALGFILLQFANMKLFKKKKSRRNGNPPAAGLALKIPLPAALSP